MATVNQDLESIKIPGTTSVGWDRATPVNERVDEHGRPVSTSIPFGVDDPRAPKLRQYNHPTVQNLRDQLREYNGIRGLEICSPEDLDRIIHIYRRDGFVVVDKLLDTNRLENLQSACELELKKILSHRPTNDRRYNAETGRLPHRYCYGTSSASRHMMHNPAWTDLIDLPKSTPILTALFGSKDYLVWGGGGDLSLPGAVEYQHLHTDGLDSQTNGEERLIYAREHFDISPTMTFSDLDFRTQKLVMEFVPPGITINFTVSELTWENGPIRQIPGTQGLAQKPPTLDQEPLWMRYSPLVGVPAGAGIFRDTRAWHGATPNLSKEIRALPSIEYAAPWRTNETFQKSMPHPIWTNLSKHARNIWRKIVQKPGMWPHGAGYTHPLAAARQQAFQNSIGTEGYVEKSYTDPSSAGTALRLFNKES